MDERWKLAEFADEEAVGLFDPRMEGNGERKGLQEAQQTSVDGASIEW
jgi:hypothetical protein